MRLCLIASKPTDAVTYGFLPAAERLGLEVFLLTDQPEAHVGALARAAVVTAGWPAGTGPAGERALAGSVPGIAGRGQALLAASSSTRRRRCLTIRWRSAVRARPRTSWPSR